MANVFISSVIPAPIDSVWAKIRDFNGLPDWHPRMVKSEIEGGLPADRIGCVRRIESRDEESDDERAVKERPPAGR